MGHHEKKSMKPEIKAKLLARKKEAKEKLKEKRARLIIRNLPFDVTIENLKEYFEKYGEVKNVELLKNNDGKLKGCGIIQFGLVQKACKARHYTNGKLFMGRNLSVEFLESKNKFIEWQNKIKQDIKQEPMDDGVDLSNIKVENDSENQDNLDLKKSDKKDENNYISSDESMKDEQEEEEDEEDDDDEIKSKIVDEPSKKPHIISHDVNEGRTVFIKNVPFSATNENLKEVMLQFGPIFYALICIDKLTEHSKGTAFVKFRNKEDAEKALSAGTELKLLGQILDCHKALDRSEINELKKPSKQPKDSRNLYLVKEGVILAGTKAAEEVSATDMTKRLQLEQYKTQMLRNLNMFISRNRLLIHNVPPKWNDKNLRDLFKKYSNKNASITESRVMRDMRNVDANGIGRSKEFGFVTFVKHEDALLALRNLNNNPNIFSANKRPIVTFAIENKKMLKLKQKRLEKSQNNKNLGKKEIPNKLNKNQAIIENVNEFSGVTAKPGKPQKMRSRYNLKTQAKLHYENLKKEKNKKKNAKKSLKEKQEEFTKQPKQKINKKNENDNFSKLVADYKKKLLNGSNMMKKSKWYDNE